MTGMGFTTRSTKRGSRPPTAVNPPADDVFVLSALCNSCRNPYGPGSHGHQFNVDPEDKLRVRIGSPRPL